MSRTPLVAGNWKMHKTAPDAVRLIEELRRSSLPSDVEAVVCPPFTALGEAARALASSAIRLGAQDMHWEAQGAFTGEIAPTMLVAAGCHYVILGHSERRQLFGETDQTVTRKVQAAFAYSLLPIVCVGERLDEREAGRTDQIITRQIEAADRKSTRLNSSHIQKSRMPSSA